MKKLFQKVLIPPIPHTSTPREAVEAVFDWILMMSVILGAPIAATGIAESLSFGKPALSFQYLGLYLPILAAQLLRKRLPLPWRFGTLAVCLYILAALNILSYGFSGAGIPLFLFLIILSSLYGNFQGGLSAVGLSLLPLLGTGTLMVLGKRSPTVNLLAITSTSMAWVTAGVLLAFLGTLLTVSLTLIKNHLTAALEAQQEQQQSLEASNRQLAGLLQEKETLLREVNHRVRNNLNVIVSLLNLKSSSIKAPDPDSDTDSDSISNQARQVFRECQEEVYAMALIQERLYQAPASSHIDMAEIFELLVREICSRHPAGKGSIPINLQAAGFQLPLSQAVPCSLILTELVNNSLEHGVQHGFQHGFQHGVQHGVQHGQDIRIRLFRRDADNTAVMDVEDNGPGFPPGWDIHTPGTIGLSLVLMQVEQLDGILSLEEPEKPGTRIRIEFPFWEGEGEESPSA